MPPSPLFEQVPLAKLVSLRRRVEDCPPPFLPDPLVLEQPIVHPNVVALDGQRGLGGLCLEDVVVVAVRAVLVALVELLCVLAEDLFAFLAGECHFHALFEGVGFLFGVAFGAVEPFPAFLMMLAVRREMGVGGDVCLRGDVQHGDRMATWALRMCLLGGFWLAGLLDVGFVVVVSCVPHGE